MTTREISLGCLILRLVTMDNGKHSLTIMSKSYATVSESGNFHNNDLGTALFKIEQAVAEGTRNDL